MKRHGKFLVSTDLFVHHPQIVDMLFSGTDLSIVDFNHVPERVAMEYEVSCVYFPEVPDDKVPMYVMCIANMNAQFIDHDTGKVLYTKYVGPYNGKGRLKK